MHAYSPPVSTYVYGDGLVLSEQLIVLSGEPFDSFIGL